MKTIWKYKISQPIRDAPNDMQSLCVPLRANAESNHCASRLASFPEGGEYIALVFALPVLKTK